MCDFSRVSAWFCDEKISLKKSCFYLYIRREEGVYTTMVASLTNGSHNESLTAWQSTRTSKSKKKAVKEGA